MRANRIELKYGIFCMAVLVALLAHGSPARAATSGVAFGIATGTATATVGIPAGTATATATPTETIGPPTPTNTRVPAFALVDEGGCAIAVAPAAGALPLLATPLVLWVGRRRRWRRR